MKKISHCLLAKTKWSRRGYCRMSRASSPVFPRSGAQSTDGCQDHGGQVAGFVLSAVPARQKKNKNSGLLSVGAVHIDIPQHPGVLHGMMTRGSKQLSSTLQEFRVPRMPSRNTGLNTSTIPDELDAVAGQIAGGDSGVFGANSAINNPAIALLPSPPKETPPAPEHRSSASGGGGKIVEREATANLLQPLVMQFSIVLQRLSFLPPAMETRRHRKALPTFACAGPAIAATSAS